MLKTWLTGLLLLLCAPLCRADIVDPLLQPEPLAVPAGMPAEELRKIILTNAKRREWVIKEQKQGEVLLRFARDNYWAEVRVEYDAKTLRVRYAGSKGLMYENAREGPKIHHNYNRWVKNLANDYNAEFTAYTLTR